MPESGGRADMSVIHGRVRLMREATSDDLWELVGFLCIGLAVLQFMRLAGG